MAVIIILGLAAGGYAYVQHRHTAHQPKITDKVNYGPPTKAEQEAGNQQKQIDIQSQNAPPATTASVYISDASQYGSTVQVRAYVANVAEDGGTCTTTFTKGSSSFSVTTTAFMAASSTQCGAIDVPSSRFPSTGSWSVVVAYSSSNLSGESQAASVTVQ